MVRRISWVVMTVVLVAASPVLAEGPTAATKDEQVKELQAQLEQMSKELADLRKLLETSQMSPQQRQTMMGHMGRMEGQMHGMMSNCCMMDPASCPAHMRQ